MHAARCSQQLLLVCPGDPLSIRESVHPSEPLPPGFRLPLQLFLRCQKKWSQAGNEFLLDRHRQLSGGLRVRRSLLRFFLSLSQQASLFPFFLPLRIAIDEHVGIRAHQLSCEAMVLLSQR